MQAKFLEYSQVLHLSDLATATYLTLGLWILNYSDLLYKLGQYDNIYIITLLLTAEILKYLVYIFSNKTSRKSLFKDIFRTISLLAVVFSVFYITAVLLGAPVFSKFEETSILALILTIFTALPCCLYLGPENTTNMLLSVTTHEGDDINPLFMWKIRLPIFGAWLGATVIPLDWNRPWQEWPIPCYLGAIIGYLLANLITSFLQFKGQKRGSKKTGKYTL